MFSKTDTSQKGQFLDKAKNAREERALDKKKVAASIKIQSIVRRYLARCRFNRDVRLIIDQMLCIPTSSETEYKPEFKPALEVFSNIKKFWLVFKENEDKQRFEYLCKYLLAGMNQDMLKYQFVSLALSKQHVIPWIHLLKILLWRCCLYFKTLKPELACDMRMVTTLLHMLITFTGTTNWKLLKGKGEIPNKNSKFRNRFLNYLFNDTKPVYIGEALQPGMNQLCNNVMGHLNQKGLYPTLQILLMKGLAKSKPTFKPASLTAIITLAMRPLLAASFSDNLLTLFLLNIMSVPAVVFHLSSMAHDCLLLLLTHRVFTRSLQLLCNEQSTKIVFNALEGNYALCLLANLIQLGFTELEGLVEHTGSFVFVVSRLLDCCQTYVQGKKSHLTHWHPVLGWFSQKTDQGLHEAMPYVKKQLQQLWNIKMIRLLFEQLFAYNDVVAAAESQRQQAASPSKNLVKRAIEKAQARQSTPKVKLDSPLVTSTCLTCKMYMGSLRTLTQLKLDILAGLCRQDILLPRLWKLITDLGPQCGLKAFIDCLAIHPNDTSHVIFQCLQLGCDTAAHIITILDDVELYEQNKPFTLDNLIAISYFLNYFIFRVIWCGLLDAKTASTNSVFNSVHSFLLLLYERDCRRNFTPKDHWLIRDIKASSFIAELEKDKKAAKFLLQKMPHIIRHKERVILFRKNVTREKEILGIAESASTSPQSTLITVHRARIIEDGYRQLAMLPPNGLKGLIRVKFINEQGLDEAGIDQDGVFKEFLEETIKRVFDPSLNLFRVTDEQKLYPSPTSYIQESHLALFEFVGRMLGKAVFEGIVVEVPFASFFLSQILGHQHIGTYSSFDELPSLDPDLYKSLTYIKHYDGDVGDLELTFAYNEDIMGKLVTYELIPGGKAIPATNDNKISYIHLMAHYKMRIQIKEQTAAFIHGFKSIVNSEWLQMFSTPELQKLISGDTTDVDLQDLRRNTKYFGGFHNNHRVVIWLWDILEKDFTPQEKAMFLKFVTSCSKPPLLGFVHLEPPFSIRCVEVSDEQDTGDTVGSVLKGFFNIRKRDPVGRLPTSSTCFNLLKLPNYQKKSTLREKLRYAIACNTGFELS